MPSIIEGYEYDIFISYRQKDNKYDGWVTEFVDNLKKELEATFKEEITVYFDINPHDGLLETHDVDESLKEKLKCLIFLPIISRTYCDHNSFAWVHEFKAFIELASKDQYGLKVKLSGGNIANRILPVQIHDLDADDKKLVEGELGGHLRGIEFIYKEPGVNKPLTHDDDEKKNLNNTKYRIQINKVANAIREVITAIKQYGSKQEELSKEVTKPTSVSLKSNKTKIISGFAIAFVLVIFGFLFVQRLIKPKEQLEKSIAVLPFENLSSDEDKLWFTDGITDIIINQLSKISEFRVLGWTSTQKYKEEKKTITDIGKELDVNYLIEGTIQRAGEKMRISVQLIRVINEGHIWSEIYDREWKDIFEVQSEIAQKISEELKVVLTPEEKALIETSKTKNPEAYNLYLQGRYFWSRRGKENLNKAIEYFEKTLAVDPAYALAIAGLADCYFIQVTNRLYTPPSEGFKKAKDLALKAIAIDEDIAEPHVTLGSVLYWSEMKWEEAKKEYLLAIRLNPNYPETYYQYAQLMDVLRQNKEARVQMNNAIEYNPFQFHYHVMSGNLFYNEGKFNESLNEYMKAQEIDPRKEWYTWKCFDVYFRLGEYSKALEAFQKQIISYYNDTLAMKEVKLVQEIYERSGIGGIIKMRIENSPKDYYYNARNYAKLGEIDQALDCLDKASENPPIDFFRINNEYDFNNLRSEPRFQTIVTKMGLSNYQYSN